MQTAVLLDISDPSIDYGRVCAEPFPIRVSLFDQAVKLSFKSKDDEDADQPDLPDEPDEQNWENWKRPPPGPCSDSARFAPY